MFTTNNIPVPDPPLSLTTREEIQLVVRWIPSYHHQNFSPRGIFQQQRIKHEWLMTCLFAFLVVSMAAMKWHSQQFGKQCYGFNIKYFTTHYWWRTSKMSCFSGNLFLFFFLRNFHLHQNWYFNYKQLTTQEKKQRQAGLTYWMNTTLLLKHMLLI